MFLRKSLLVLLACATVAAGCRRQGFDARLFDSMDALYAESMRQFEARRWANAARGFERLTTELPARDPRLASVYFHLGSAQQRMGEYLTAAQTFQRVSESFPDDTLADDALFQAGRSYSALWRKPTLDAQHGHSAMNVYQTLVVLYPGSPLLSETQAEIARLEQMLATKDYEAGYHYFRLRAYDSAIIYFTDVIEKYPNAARTRSAYLRLLESYRAIRYTEDARELCTAMLARYPGDSEIARECSATG
jgi:outer membrane protein assembly factor BamD